MKANMGSVDRIIRIVLAVVMGVLWYQGIVSGVLGIVLIVAAAIFALTSFISFCPLYLPFGLSTKKKQE